VPSSPENTQTAASIKESQFIKRIAMIGITILIYFFPLCPRVGFLARWSSHLPVFTYGYLLDLHTTQNRGAHPQGFQGEHRTQAVKQTPTHCQGLLESALAAHAVVALKMTEIPFLLRSLGTMQSSSDLMTVRSFPYHVTPAR